MPKVAPTSEKGKRPDSDLKEQKRPKTSQEAAVNEGKEKSSSQSLESQTQKDDKPVTMTFARKLAIAQVITQRMRH
jgi:hypothetical protein